MIRFKVDKHDFHGCKGMFESTNIKSASKNDVNIEFMEKLSFFIFYCKNYLEKVKRAHKIKFITKFEQIYKSCDENSKTIFISLFLYFK